MWLDHSGRTQAAAPRAVTSDELPPLLRGDDQPLPPPPNGKRLTGTGNNCVCVSLRPSALGALARPSESGAGIMELSPGANPTVPPDAGPLESAGEMDLPSLPAVLFVNPVPGRIGWCCGAV